MRRFFLSIFCFALIAVLSLAPAACAEGETDKTLTFINRTGYSICEFYVAPESAKSWGSIKNAEWIKSEEQIEVTFTAEQLASEAEWKVRIGVYRAGKVAFTNFNHVDLASLLETGIAGFMPEKEGSTVINLLPCKKEFFYFSNTTDFIIESIFLMPSEIGVSNENRLEKPLQPGEYAKIKLTYDEVMMEGMWNFRMGINKGGTITYFTLQEFPLSKLTDCECVVLKPYKDSCSFHYSNEPFEE